MSLSAYIPTQWQTGDLITEPLLNHAEDGIAKATNKLATGTIPVSGTSVTVTFTGDYIASYAVQNGEEVIVDTQVNANNVVFSVAANPTSAVTCNVIYA